MLMFSHVPFLKMDHALRRLIALSLMAFLTACSGGLGSLPGLGTPEETVEAPPPPPSQQAATAPASGPSLGTGAVRVALILPLSSSGSGGSAALALKNAAELALSEAPNSDLTLLIKDDRGTPEGAREATQQAVQEGAELIVGPLFSSSVQAAGSVARAGNRPVLAFSTDATAATPGVYLLSFLPQSEAQRVITFAASKGKKSFAALIPETAYGNAVEAQFRQTVAQLGGQVVAVERYSTDAQKLRDAVNRLRPAIGGNAPLADALFLPESADILVNIGQMLQSVGFQPERVKPLGTGTWNDPRALKVTALNGGWFAAPDNAGYMAFAQRYKAKFQSEPIRIATLGYDAVALVAALTRTQGAARFQAQTLTMPTGFAGTDGVFRFRGDGLSERGLPIFELRNGNAVVVQAAPASLK
jgi:ABC-type branched-subunit amino acid transport system substrate-binding protein